jgi:hypothetical protein
LTFDGLKMVDHTALRTNQAFIIAGTLAAFVLNSIWLAAFVGAAMLLGVAFGRPGFLPAYRILSRLGWIQPDRLPDHPEPHRFAQLVGGLFLAFATAALALGQSLIGWSLAWLVIGLAALNLFGGFCLGCAVYYWLSRAGWPGFTQAPPPGTSPGWRPDLPQDR